MLHVACPVATSTGGTIFLIPLLSRSLAASCANLLSRHPGGMGVEGAPQRWGGQRDPIGKHLG
jgi:hypothetical protein